MTAPFSDAHGAAAAARSPDLRPLGIGELIDRAAHGWRRNFGTLFRLYIVFQLGAFCMGKLFELAMRAWFPLVRGGAPMAQAINEGRIGEIASQYALFFVTGTPLMLFGVWLGWVVGVVGSWFYIRQLLGQPATLAGGIQRLRERIGTVTGAFLLSTLWAVVVTVLCLLPGGVLVVTGAAIAGGSPVVGGLMLGFGALITVFGLLVSIVLFFVRFLLTAQVIAMEDVDAMTAVRRSGALVSGRVGPSLIDRVKIRATLLLTIASAILLVVGLAGGLPATIIHFMYASPFDPMNANPDAVPQLLMVPAQLLQVLVQAAFAPLFMVLSALFYVDMRVRREGLDLELKLSA